MRYLVGGLVAAAGWFTAGRACAKSQPDSWARTLQDIEALPVFAGNTLDGEPQV